MKRPLGLACLFFILFIRLFYICFPPEVPDYSGWKGREVYVRGRISSIQIQEFEGSLQTMCQLEGTHLQDKNSVNDTYISDKIYIHDNIRCYISQNNMQLHIGDVVWIRGFFTPFDAAENPGQFDSRFYFHVQGIGGSVEDAHVIWQKTSKVGILNTIAVWKTELLNKVDIYFDARYAGVIKTILLGDKSDLASDLKTLYQESGILHILTISGMHISMLGMGCYKLFRKLGSPMRLSAVIGLLVVLFYGALVGTQAATFRATVMFSMQMAAIFLGRTYDRLTGLSVAAILLLLEEPLYVFYSGFLLSFGAVLGITVVTPMIEGLGKDSNGCKKFILKVFSGSIAILITTLPIQLYFYYEYPLYSMLINALLLPFLPYIVVFGLAVLLLPLRFGKWAEPFVTAGQWILYGYEWICTECRRLPYHVLVIGAPSGWQIILYYVCIIALLYCMSGKFVMKFKGTLLYVFCSYLCVTALLLWRPSPEFSCHFLSVGQGDCTIIRYDKEAYLVDGGSTSNLKTAEEIILPCLKYYGIGKVDGVFISHADADHMNGIMQWLENYEHSHVQIGRIILPSLSKEALAEEFGNLLALAEARNIPISVIGAGDLLELGELNILALHPEKTYDSIEDSNGYSQVLLWEYCGKGIFMTGDIGSKQETEIVERIDGNPKLHNRLISLDTLVLKTPHHGSKYSSSEKFLDFFKPQYAMISYGLGNSYGHPHGEVLERLQAINTKVYRTARSGMLTVKVMDGEVSVEAYRK